MSEITENTGTEETGTENNGTENNGTGTPVQDDPPVRNPSVINAAIQAVMDLIDALSLFATITRGALGTAAGLACEIGPSAPDEVYLDKGRYLVIDLTINGKHPDLETLSDALNTIDDSLTGLFEYPTGDNWQIADITTQTEPRIIGREDNNEWLMACDLLVKVFHERNVSE